MPGNVGGHPTLTASLDRLAVRLTDRCCEPRTRSQPEPPAVTGFAFGMPAEMDERERWLVSGIAPPGVGRVAVSVPGGEGVIAVEPASGAFLFAAATGDVQSEQLRPTP